MNASSLGRRLIYRLPFRPIPAQSLVKGAGVDDLMALCRPGRPYISSGQERLRSMEKFRHAHAHATSCKPNAATALSLTVAAAPAGEEPAASMHPTLTLMKQRLQENSMPGARTDEFKLGLVVEGGGMQGIISAAMLLQLSLLGLRNTFDAVYGASAGAINAAYFISGQDDGINVYTEHLCCGRFLDLSALLPPALKAWSLYSSRGSVPIRTPSSAAPAARAATRPVMDLAYLLDHVMVKEAPLDWDAVISSPLPLKVVASSLDQLRPVLLDAFSSPLDLADCLAASANVPEVAGPPRIVRGQRCVDAAVFEPVPVASAVRDGCTHVLVLCTRPAAAAGGATTVTKAAKRVLKTAVTRTVMSPQYMRDAWRASSGSSSDEDDLALYDALTGCSEASRSRLGAHVLPLYPRTTGGVHPVCTDVPKLLAGRQEGSRAVLSAIGEPLGLRPRPLASAPGREDAAALTAAVR